MLVTEALRLKVKAWTMSQQANPMRTIYRYEDILRAIGRHIDANDIQDVIVIQSKGQFHLHGVRSASPKGVTKLTQVRHVFTAEDVEAIDAQSRKLRGTGSRIHY